MLVVVRDVGWVGPLGWFGSLRWVEVIGMDRGVLDKMVEVVVMGSVLRLVIGIGWCG